MPQIRVLKVASGVPTLHTEASDSIRVASLGLGTPTPPLGIAFDGGSGEDPVLGAFFTAAISNTGPNAAVSLQLQNTGASRKTRIVLGGDTTATQWELANDPTGNLTHAFALRDLNAAATRWIVDSAGRMAIGPSTPDASALLELSSTTSGFLPPRMTTSQRDAIASPATGLIVYNTTTSQLEIRVGTWAPVTVEPSVQQAADADDSDVICMIGTSLFSGDGANGDAATGPREAFFQEVRRYRSKFTLVGPHGEGALNGTGSTWGRFHATDDYHASDALPPLGFFSHHGESGRKMVASFTVTAVNDTTNVITATAHDLGNGSLFVISSSGGSVPGGLSPSSYYFASGVSGANLQAAALEGGTALDLLDQGSGTITIGTGLAQLVAVTLPLLSPKTTITCAGTNDIAERVDASDPDPLATCQARAQTMFAAIEAGAPNAARHIVTSIPSFYTPATNFATKAAVVASFNAWLATYIPTRGRKWAFVDGAKNLTAAHSTDGIHLSRAGNRLFAQNLARGYLLATQGAAPGQPVPRPRRMRKSQSILNLTAISHVVSIPDQASIRVAGDNAAWLIWFRPSTLATGVNVILQQNNSYPNGFLLAQTGANLSFYFRQGGTTIPASNYTAVLKKDHWHRIMVLVDHDKDQAALYINGRHVQTVNITDATITTQQPLYLGSVGGLNAALGQYQGPLIVAHGPDLTIANALEIAEADYYDAKDPPNLSAKYQLDEGTGTSVAGTVSGSTPGTIAGATWLPAGAVPRVGIDDGALAPGQLFEFPTAALNPVIRQADDATASATGDVLRIQGQTMTGSGSTGGKVEIFSGGGVSAPGAVDIGCGSTTVVTLTQTTARVETPATVDSNGANTAAILRLENTAGNIDVFRTDATPEGAVTGSIGDVAVDSTSGVVYLKTSGNATNTGWRPVPQDGGIWQVTAVKTSTYTAAVGELVRGDASGGAFTVNLPAAATFTGRAVQVKNVGASNNVTVDANGSETIDGGLTLPVPPGVAVVFVSDGTNIIAT